MIRMRFPAQALEDLRKTDPDTPVSPSIPVGNGNRRLLNFDALLAYLENPTESQPKQTHGIRRIDERAGV